MARLFSKEARNREKPDIIIATLPIHYCAYEAVKFGNENGIPVIVDIRDYWPDIFLLYFPKVFRRLGRLIFRNDFKVTKVALQNATALVSMMNPLLEWGLDKYAGRKRSNDDKVFFIGGDDVDASRYNNLAQFVPGIERKIRNRFIVTYIGSFGHFSHPMVIIEAAKYLNSAVYKDHILFILAGNGEYYKKCINAARELDNVVFLGWIDSNVVAALASISSVGVIPSVEKFSFPNKAFSYLAAGLPILSSEHGDLNSLLEEYKAGFYFDISDPVELANKILYLSKLDHEAYRKISENAKFLFQSHMRADKIYKGYADYIEYIANKYYCR